MSENTEKASNGLDMFKWVVVFALLGGVVAGNTYYEDMSVLYRAIGAVVGVVIAGFVAATTEKGSTFINFAKESRIEVRKVIWPTRQETTQTTLVILAATVFVALVLWGLDTLIVKLIGFVTGVGGA